jgi:hypothetical protein
MSNIDHSVVSRHAILSRSPRRIRLSSVPGASRLIHKGCIPCLTRQSKIPSDEAAYPAISAQGEEVIMDSARHCLDQSAECHRLIQLARSEADAYALKLLARSWSGLAGQIDRYNALVRQQPPVARKVLPERPREQGPP